MRNMLYPFNEIIMDTKYEGAFVLPPRVTTLCTDGSTTLTTDGWTLFNPSCLALDPENHKEKITQGSGPKVKFQGNACYVSKDFDVEEDWWQLYPSLVTNLVIGDDTLIINDS